jgi:uncharacterized protein involved in type VI secretion and phage assembly
MKTSRSVAKSPIPSAPDPRAIGVCSARVTDVRDPDGVGRVKVSLLGPSRAPQEAWARLATLTAGSRAGSWFVPDVDDEVLVAFDSADPRQPFVIGALWSKRNPPPESMDPAGANTRKVLRTRGGVQVTLDDQAGQEKLVVQTPGGQRIALTDGPASIQIADANGNSVSLDPTGITINAAAKVTVNASQVTVSAGLVQVDAGMAKFSGAVQCDTLVANSVVSARYSPGAGNIM